MKTVATEVRGVSMRLVAYTRALKLCARMNYETEVLDFIDRMPPQSVFYDLGACEGRFAIYAALKQMRCFAFEPEQLNHEALQCNLTLNEAYIKEPVTVFPYAVGANEHVAMLRIGQRWAGGHQRILDSVPSDSVHAVPYEHEQSVQVISLDELIDAESLPKPQYLKIDIDGSEWAAIQGAFTVLSDSTLQGVLIELCETDSHFPACIETLTGHGFELIRKYAIENNLYNYWFVRAK